LAGAVAAAGPECVVRPFVDGGPPVQAVLAELRRAAAHDTAAFLDTVLHSFPGAPVVRPAGRQGLVEPLTTREREVLRLLADGRSNAGMARLLSVEQSTVKTHLIHVYEKLGVHSRTQAVARARALRLLD